MVPFEIHRSEWLAQSQLLYVQKSKDMCEKTHISELSHKLLWHTGILNKHHAVIDKSAVVANLCALSIFARK